MNRFFLLTFIIISSVYPSDTDGINRRIDHPRLFLHERVNYEFSAAGDLLWNRSRYSKNGMRLSYGSIGKSILLRNEELIIDQNLSERIKFRGIYKNYEGRIYPEKRLSVNLGLSLRVREGLYAGGIFKPHFEKDNMDAGLKILWLGESKEEYIGITLTGGDMFYDKRNTVKGEQIQDPLKVGWNIRKSAGPLNLSSWGSAGRGHVRIFSDHLLSNGTVRHEYNSNKAVFLADIKLFGRNLAVVHGLFYRFTEKEFFAEQEKDHAYSYNIDEFGIRNIFSINENWSFTTGTRYIRLRTERKLFSPFSYRRNELMPEIRLNYISGRVEYSAAYFSSFIDLKEKNAAYNTKEVNPYEDKAEISAEIFFGKTGSLTLSLSHVTTIDGFGGGNVRYIMYF